MGETLTSKDLTKFAYGVAKGMEFLVTKGVSIILTEKYLKKKCLKVRQKLGTRENLKI